MIWGYMGVPHPEDRDEVVWLEKVYRPFIERVAKYNARKQRALHRRIRRA